MPSPACTFYYLSIIENSVSIFVTVIEEPYSCQVALAVDGYWRDNGQAIGVCLRVGSQARHRWQQLRVAVKRCVASFSGMAVCRYVG